MSLAPVWDRYDTLESETLALEGHDHDRVAPDCPRYKIKNGPYGVAEAGLEGLEVAVEFPLGDVDEVLLELLAFGLDELGGDVIAEGAVDRFVFL